VSNPYEAPRGDAPPPTAEGGRVPARSMGVVTATSLVVASMVGTGVFTTTGLLVASIPSATGILLCWAVAGLLALSGALAYAELGAAHAASGGEYLFLSRLIHPSLGFLSAFTSLIVGFAAPLAAIAWAFGEYLSVLVPALSPRIAGAALILIMSLLNALRVEIGTRFQDASTIGKVLLIVAFIVAGAFAAESAHLGGGPATLPIVASPGFAVGLLWTSFSYTGWNAAAYVAGEVRQPARTLPIALVGGTLLVTLLYVGLNAVFLASAPLEALAGQIKVGHVAAEHLFGPRGARWLSAIIALGLVSTVGAVAITGPRIYEAVGHDYPALSFLARRDADGGPRNAIAIQAAIALVMLFTSSFDGLLLYIGFTLSIFGALTVAAVFVLRSRGLPRPYSMLGYPVTPVLYIGLALWMIIAGLIEAPVTALYGFGTLALGVAVYVLAGKRRA
jgi:APA family basic amino acid/polyamine antiporter